MGCLLLFNFCMIKFQLYLRLDEISFVTPSLSSNLEKYNLHWFQRRPLLHTITLLHQDIASLKDPRLHPLIPFGNPFPHTVTVMKRARRHTHITRQSHIIPSSRASCAVGTEISEEVGLKHGFARVIIHHLFLQYALSCLP